MAPACTETCRPITGTGSFSRLLDALLAVASTKLTVEGITGPTAVGVIATACTCTPTVPVTAPKKVESELTVRVLRLLVPMLTFPFAAKVLVLAIVTEAPASDELNTVVLAVTVSDRLLPCEPNTALPWAVRVPANAMLTSELAVTGALKVLTALTTSV